jgi:mono/diheme cytochrome c family protein
MTLPPITFRTALACTFAVSLPAVAEEVVDFRAKIAPVLEAKCVSCHRGEKKKGGFDLTTREAMLKGGEDDVGLVPGKPDDSAVYSRAVAHDGEKPEMPKKGEPLTPEEAAALKAWIVAGAPWPEGVTLREKAKADGSFWSFQPLAKPEPPAADDAPPAWRANPIDRFIFAQLREKKLAPNPPAEPRAFIRRASYDLTGLPPTPEEVAAFVDETRRTNGSHETYEKLIDRLLASPHYGERWGRHWLDVVRFGESRGFERNQIITNLWPFRDYVIRAFNDDKPFDQFVREHLAGDVVGKNQPDVEIGSAFLVAGPYDDVGNQDPIAAAQIRADTLDEMIRATSEAFLGLTVGCARCHDHKFDPIAARDYYALYATFAGTVHGERPVATAEEERAHAEKLRPLEAEKKRLAGERSSLEKEIDERVKAAEVEAAKAWTRPKLSGYGTEEKFAPAEARQVRLLIEGTNANDTNSRDKGKRGEIKIDEFEVWTGGEAPRNVALASNGGQARGETKRAAKDFAGAYDVALVNDGKFGERWHAAGDELVITFAQPERIERVFFSSDRGRGLAEGAGLTAFVGDYRIEVSLDGKEWREVATSADREPATAARKQARLLKLVTTKEETERLTKLEREVARVEGEIAKLPPLPTWWVGTHKAAPGPFNVFLGGNPQRKGDDVMPASLRVLDRLDPRYELDAKGAEGERRLALAKWLCAPQNPLTPRVLANRIWHYHFGRGIVETPSDFGYMGMRPSHPELLDWLAGQLLANGWHWKPLHRLIMTSQAYRQSAAWREDAAREDGDSRLLWRFPPRRLAAEEVRDTLLSVAGQLDLAMFGPGYRLYEYQQDNVATYVPLDVPGPETYRRGIYHHNARAARVDVMTDFDCPDPSYAEARRASTTTPLQALTLMNNRFAIDMAGFLAERLQREGEDVPTQVARAFELSYARAPQPQESSRAAQLIATHGLRAFCRALLNSNELINLN